MRLCVLACHTKSYPAACSLSRLTATNTPLRLRPDTAIFLYDHVAFVVLLAADPTCLLDSGLHRFGLACLRPARNRLRTSGPSVFRRILSASPTIPVFSIHAPSALHPSIHFHLHTPQLSCTSSSCTPAARTLCLKRGYVFSHLVMCMV